MGSRMRLFLFSLSILSILCCFTAATASAAEKTVSLNSLLDEMVDRDVLARFPDPAYDCRQFSSYDPASVSADRSDTWFANGDRGHYLYVEEHDGRKEWVMMEADGPGAVVRIWSANPMGTLRIYLDRQETPVIEAPLADLLDGRWKIPVPLAWERSKGHNLYLPIPYGSHCKVTCDKGDFYYQVNYRSYEAGTQVESLTPAILEASLDKVTAVAEQLLMKGEWAPRSCLLDAALDPSGTTSKEFKVGDCTCYVRDCVIDPGATSLISLHSDPQVIRQLAIRTDTLVRSLVLELSFDFMSNVWCPLPDFFGAGAGAEEVKDYYRAGKGRDWVSLWPMPFESEATICITNHGKEPARVALGIMYAPWEWDERSMHFNTTWRFEHPIHTQPRQDWNYVDVKGKGLFVGDTLAVINPVEGWWGEGDEKIYFDGQTFPSHFGTGTEDYYGYAWCSHEPFLAPFHSQPRCDGHALGNNWGHTTIGRVRALDAIPFQNDFRFDMEVWHWVECDMGYAATSHFYALPGAEHNREPLPEVAGAPVPEPTPLPPPHRIDGAIECEEMEVVAHSEGMPLGSQKMKGYGKETASNDLQLWCQGRRPGDFVELKFPAPGDGRYRVKLYAIRSWDYGILRFHVNGKDTGKEVDLFNTAGKAVAPTGAIDLGVFEAKDGAMILRAEVVGGHPDSEGSKSFFGLDCVVLEPAG